MTLLYPSRGMLIAVIGACALITAGCSSLSMNHPETAEVRHADTVPQPHAIMTVDGRSLLGLVSVQPSAIKEPPPLPRVVALTFDDGPHPRTTEKTLAVLRKYGVPATFFVVGEQVTLYPDLAKKIVEDDHELGNHSWSHDPAIYRSKDTLLRDALHAEEDIRSVTGVTPHVYRPPYGVMSSVLSVLPMPLITWSVDPQDWRKTATAESIAHDVITHVHPGAIILFHETGRETTAALPTVITNLQKQGYTFHTVSDLLGSAMQSGSIYPSASIDMLLTR